MSAQPYLTYNTLCLAAPSIGQPQLILAPSDQNLLYGIDMVTEQQPTQFCRWLTHEFDKGQSWIRPTEILLIGTGTITQGTMTLQIDGRDVYTVDVTKLERSPQNNVLVHCKKMESSVFGFKMAIDWVLSGHGISFHKTLFRYIEKEG